MLYSVYFLTFCKNFPLHFACIPCSVEMRNLKTAIEDNQRELNNLRSAVKNKLKKYGSRIPDVIARIHMDYKQGKFHRKPIGPVGKFIRILFFTHLFLITHL